MTISQPPRIECLAVSKEFRSGDHRVRVLDGVDFTVKRGEFVAILGPSGSGKSTLLGLMAGFERLTSGVIRCDGQSLGELSEDELALLRRRHIGFVFQSFQLIDNLTARENILLPLELIGARDARPRTEELLERLGLPDRGHHYPAQLSGGEQQRVAIARAFAPRPSLLLADEPTGNLDARTGAQVLDLLLELREREDMTLVLVTHDQAIASRAERRIELESGRIVRDSSAPSEESAARDAKVAADPDLFQGARSGDAT